MHRRFISAVALVASVGVYAFAAEQATERSEMRYVVRIAEFSESSNLRTQNALSGYSWEHASSSAVNDCDLGHSHEK